MTASTHLTTTINEMSLVSQLHYNLLQTNEEDILAKYPEFQNRFKNLMKSDDEKQFFQLIEHCLTQKTAYLHNLQKIGSKDALAQLEREHPSIQASEEEKIKSLQNLLEKMEKSAASSSSNEALLLPLQGKKIEYTMNYFAETNKQLNRQISNLITLARKQYAEVV